MNTAEDIANECLQGEVQTLAVDCVNGAQTIAESLRVIQSGDQNETLWRVHDTMMGDRGHIGGEWSCQGAGLLLFLLVDRFVRSDGDSFVEAQTRTVVAISVDVGEHGHKELGLVTFRAQGPAEWLAELGEENGTKALLFIMQLKSKEREENN